MGGGYFISYYYAQLEDPKKLGFLKQILELANQKRSYVEKKGWEGSKVSHTVGIGR